MWPRTFSLPAASRWPSFLFPHTLGGGPDGGSGHCFRPDITQTSHTLARAQCFPLVDMLPPLCPLSGFPQPALKKSKRHCAENCLHSLVPSWKSPVKFRKTPAKKKKKKEIVLLFLKSSTKAFLLCLASCSNPKVWLSKPQDSFLSVRIHNFECCI